MSNAYNKYMYLNKIEDLKEKISSTKRILDICYSKNKLEYDDILKLSQYLDLMINKYYKLKKNNEISNLCEDNFLYYNDKKIS